MLTLGYDGSKPTCSNRLPREDKRIKEPSLEWPEWADEILENKKEPVEEMTNKHTKTEAEPADWPSSEESETEDLDTRADVTKVERNTNKNTEEIMEKAEEAAITRMDQKHTTPSKEEISTKDNEDKTKLTTTNKRKKRYIKICLFQELSDDEEWPTNMNELIKRKSKRTKLIEEK